MCGIAGFYGFRDDKLIKEISLKLKHRGPDGEGFYIDDSSTLLNRRLAIIDLESGDQPIYNEDKSIVVVYNGEIYNYEDLKKSLIEKGHKFSTKTDTEIIVHSYEEWGDKCFDKFNGMFAIALYDKKKKKTLLVRDHFGIKPLYYSILNNQKLIFSSEIKPIFYSGLVKKQPNDRIIYRYLKYRIHDDQKETFFKNIFRLLPGELLEITNEKIVVKSYTSFKEDLIKLSQEQKNHHSDSETVELFKQELIKAIKYRLIADVPVGTCLSGGLDSSTVVSIVNKLLNEQVKEAQSVGDVQKTFSAVFPGGANDEEKYIDKLGQEQANIKFYKIRPTPEKFFEEITDFVRTQEEPTISTGPYAQYKVMQEAQGKVKVLLDGQGADEMMAGYLPYYFVYLKQLWKTGKYFALLKESLCSLDVITRYIKEKISYSLSSTELLNSQFSDQFEKEKFEIENSNLKKRLIQDIFSNSLQSLLRYEDKNTMRFSIEGRVPFLDFNLVRYIFSLPDEYIIKNGWNKFILREATTDLLPKIINRRRNKIGFTTPEYEWFMSNKKKIFEILLSKTFSERKYFNRTKVLSAFQKFIDGEVNDTMIFWRLINVELWLREFFDMKVHKIHKIKKLKKLDIKISGKTYSRHLIKTEPFKKGDDYVNKISEYVDKIMKKTNKRWFVVVSEKIVAIAQGRSYFIWDIKPSFWARTLSKYVKKTPYGIGLGSPWTMQIAIQEVGLLKILQATLVSVITKFFGVNGMFYRIAGETVRSIDGPTEYSLYPSNVSAKLGPKEPQLVAQNIKYQIINNQYQISNFLGVVVIDANDIGVNILGNSTGLEKKLIEKVFKDNPMGQTNEQTPITLVMLS